MPTKGPSLLDRLVFIAARAHAKRCLNRFLHATQRANAVQQHTLMDKIRRNASSDFGRAFGFSGIRSYGDFVRQVPVLSYDDHHPYIERVKKGEFSAMFGNNERVLMFALTSGTSAEPKYIPVTKHVLEECRTGWNAFGVKAMLDHPDAFLRRIVQVSSRMDESRTEAGIPCGAITGLMAATQKRLVRKYYVAPLAISYIDDATAKYYAIMRLAIPENVAFTMTASPATQLALARTADEHREQIIRDIHDGTLWRELPIDPHIREQLAPRLKPAPETARRMEHLVTTHGALLPKHYWKMSFLGNWTGGTMGLYLRDFPKYYGETPVRDVGLIASEGRMTIPIDDYRPVGVLEVMGNFYEFIPREERDSKQPTVLRSHELETGREYFILLTTSSGLYRYDIGDLVRMHGYYNEAPLLEFLNKGDHISSMSGEKLTEQQVILAMQHATQSLGLETDVFVLAPHWAERPYYVLHVESADNNSQSAKRLAESLDRVLGEINVEYASKRHTNRLAAVRVNYVPRGFFAELDGRLRTRHRRGNEQYKHQYLYVTPDADGNFPTYTAH